MEPVQRDHHIALVIRVSVPQPRTKRQEMIDMKNRNRIQNRNPSKNPATRGALPVASAVALAAAFALSLAQPARADADEVTPPPLPANIQVPAGNTAHFVGHATGTQNYVCLPSSAGFKFTLFTPQASLFNGHNKQLATHYFSPNPFEAGTIRATWQARDTSTVWGLVEDTSSDPNFVQPNAIAWLRLKVVGTQEGPSGGDTLTETTYIQRLNTTGGLAPAAGCVSPADVGKQAFVPYTADYFFYTAH
jgi:hypothetical protein